MSIRILWSIVVLTSFVACSYFNISMDFLDSLKIKHCLLIRDSYVEKKARLVQEIKMYSKNKVSVSTIDAFEMRNLLVERTFLFQIATLVVFQIRNETALTSFKKFSEVLNLKNPYTWMVFLSNGLLLDPYDVGLRYDSQFLIAQPVSGRFFEIYEFCKIKSKRKKLLLGTWTSENGLIITKETLFQRRRNFEGETFNIITMDTRWDDCTDQCWDLDIWKDYCGPFLNYTTVSMSNERYLKLTDEGVDIAADGMVLRIAFYGNMRERRYEAVGPIGTDRLHIYMRMHSESSTTYAAYLKPFNATLWWTILGWLTLFTLSLVCVQVTLSKAGVIKKEAPSFSYGFLPLESLFNQRGQDIPSSASFRIIYYLTLLVAIMITFSYSAEITSLFLMQDVRLPFTGLEGFIKDGTYNMTGWEEGFRTNIFKVANDTDMQYIAKHHLVPDTGDIKEIVKRLCHEKLVLFETREVSCNEEALRYCPELAIAPKPVMQIHYGMALRIGSEFTEAFHTSLLAIRSSGFMEYQRTNQCVAKTRETEFHTEADLATSNVFVIGGGIALSILILISERIIFWFSLFNDANDVECDGED